MKYTLTNAQLECQSALDSCTNCAIIKSIRSGKTLCMLDYIKTREFKKVLWLVPYVDNINGVLEEIDKWGIKFKGDIICYGSIHKHIGDYDLVICDEGHRITNKHFDSLIQIPFKKLVVMTGTYPTGESKLEILNKLGVQIVYQYTIHSAVKDGGVAPFNISYIVKDLDKQKMLKIEYKDKSTKQVKSFFTSEFDSYNRLSQQIALENHPKRKMLLTFNRLRMLNTLPSTIDLIKRYIAHNKDKRVLIFVSTKEMAEKCSQYCYYGGKSDKHYKDFHSGKINHLVLVEKATIGITYEDIDGCLLSNINSSNASVQQKIFRSVLFRPGYTADIKIIINKNTVQEKWIEKALINI